jgi:hypothetical protein
MAITNTDVHLVTLTRKHLHIASANPTVKLPVFTALVTEAGVQTKRYL